MTHDKVLLALSDPTRRLVLERLKGGPKSVNEIAKGLPVSRPAVSQHLKLLKEAELVRERREGRRNIYRLDPTGLGALRNYLEGFWLGVLEDFAEALEKESEKPRR